MLQFLNLRGITFLIAALWHHLVVVKCNIYLPTTTIDTKKQPNVIDVFRSVSYNGLSSMDQQLSMDHEIFDERYFNQQLQHPKDVSNHVKCLYLVAFSSRPTTMERSALSMLIGSEANIIKNFPDNSYLIWARRATSASASVAINHLTWSGKFLSKYKYTTKLLKAIANTAAKEKSKIRSNTNTEEAITFTVLVQVVQFTDMNLFTNNLMNKTLVNGVLTKAIEKSQPVRSSIDSSSNGGDSSVRSKSSPSSFSIISISVMRKNTIKLTLLSRHFQIIWSTIKRVASYCEVVEITPFLSVQEVEEEEVHNIEHQRGRSKLLLLRGNSVER